MITYPERAFALAIVVAGYFLQDLVLDLPYHAIRAWMGISPPPAHTLVCAAYTLLVTLRLVCWLAVTGLVVLIDPKGIADVLRLTPKRAGYFLKGIVIGLVAMGATVLTIVATGNAQLHPAHGTPLIHTLYGVVWMVGDIIGAAGEELLYRCLILILAAHLFGIRTAIVVSAAAFSYSHGANPGVSLIWLIRLCAAGLLLAYSVFRSGSIWWGIGYHAGWNFASAPLFGAAGSGYSDQGHIFNFLPTGSAIITGGPVGPEGSAFAFIAVVFATVCLFLTVPRNHRERLL